MNCSSPDNLENLVNSAHLLEILKILSSLGNPAWVAILPEIAEELRQRARAQDVSIETLVNVLLSDSLRESTPTS